MKESDVRQITDWIMSLSAKASTAPSLPTTGKIVPPAEITKGQSVLSLKATYSDMGTTGLKSLTANDAITLRNSEINAKDIKDISEFGRKDAKGDISLIFPQKAGWIKLSQIDLTDIAALQLALNNPTGTYAIEVRLDGEDGKVLASSTTSNLNIPIEAVTDGKFHDVYILAKNTTENVKDRPSLKAVTVSAK
jgi:cytochrome c